MEILGDTITRALINLATFLPQLLGGLIVLIVGLLLASILRDIVFKTLKYLKIEQWSERLGGKVPAESVWAKILAEIVRWTVIILFLIPAAEAWNLPRVTVVLNQVLFYIPNVIVAVVVGFVGFGIANLIFDVVKNAASSMGSESSNLLAAVARYSIFFFTALIVLNQLGIAADLIRILFTGIVAMFALAGGIAFGLGGQDSARKIFEEFRKKLEEK